MVAGMVRIVRALAQVGHVGLLVVGVSLAGCATHGDFVSLRQEVRTAVKSQAKAHTQSRQERKALLRRLQALEVAKESGDLSQQLDTLTRRVQGLEKRIARLGGPRPPRPAGALDPSGVIGDFPDLSRPAKTDADGISETSPNSLLSLTPTSAFNLAYNDYLNGRYDLSIGGFRRFLKDFPATSLTPKAHFWLGEAYYQKRDYVRAMQAYKRLVSDYPGHEKVAAALFKLGMTAAETGDRAKAREYLKRVIEDHSPSTEANLAKNKLAEIR